MENEGNVGRIVCYFDPDKNYAVCDVSQRHDCKYYSPANADCLCAHCAEIGGKCVNKYAAFECYQLDVLKGDHK